MLRGQWCVRACVREGSSIGMPCTCVNTSRGVSRWRDQQQPMEILSGSTMADRNLQCATIASHLFPIITGTFLHSAPIVGPTISTTTGTLSRL